MTRFVHLICLTLCFSFLSGCYERHQWRQKLTIVVETPSGEVTGSSVVQVNANYYGQLPATGTEVEYWTSGEATMVEIAPGKYLFALLGGARGLFYDAARERFQGLSREEWLREIPRQTQPVELQDTSLVTFATFLDIGQPSSFTLLQTEEFEKYFGTGIGLKSISLEITSEQVTRGRVEGFIEQLYGAKSGQLFGGDESLDEVTGQANQEIIFRPEVPVGQLVTSDRWRVR